MLQRMFGLFLLINYANALIVPQEVPSILSLVYSNIPPFKKGTDSRVGFGYRLGDHADFQVLFELGPQTNTKPIGPNGGDSDTSKRNVNQNDYVANNPPKSEGSEWLSNWSQGMKTKSNKNPNKPIQMVDTAHTLQTGPFISESALKQLQQLYGKGHTQNEAPSTFPDGIGTLPAVAMDDVIRLETESHQKYLLPNAVSQAKAKPQADKSKITADLMDVDFD